MKKTLFFAILTLATSLFGQSAEVVLREGLNRPHSLIYFPARGSFLASNIQGSLMERDAYSSLVSVRSPFMDAGIKFKEGFKALYLNEGKSSGLSAPAGMVLLGDTLAVADIDKIALFSVEDNGQIKPLTSFSVKGAQSLGVMVKLGSSSLAVADPKANKIYKIENCLDADSRLISVLTSKIRNPTGLLADDGQLFVVSPSSNKLYIYDLAADKPDRSIAIGPKAKKDQQGFVSITRGLEGEFYFIHKDHRIVYLYSLDWERKRYVKPFIKELRSPDTLYYHEAENKLFITSFFSNAVSVYPALRPRPVSE
jgi:hypothetical protein